MSRRDDVGSAQDWLRRARSSLSLSMVDKPPGVMLEDLCFHTQQAAEEAIKAVLCHSEIDFRPVHDLAESLTNLLSAGVDVAAEVREAVVLTQYSVTMRYPGFYEPVTSRDHQEAVQHACNTVAWAASVIEGPHPTGTKEPE